MAQRVRHMDRSSIAESYNFQQKKSRKTENWVLFSLSIASLDFLIPRNSPNVSYDSLDC